MLKYFKKFVTAPHDAHLTAGEAHSQHRCYEQQTWLMVVNQDSVTGALHQHPETKAAKWNSAIVKGALCNAFAPITFLT